MNAILIAGSVLPVQICGGNVYPGKFSFLEIIHGDERRKALERRRIQGAVCSDCLFKDARRLISEILKMREPS